MTRVRIHQTKTTVIKMSGILDIIAKIQETTTMVVRIGGAIRAKLVKAVPQKSC